MEEQATSQEPGWAEVLGGCGLAALVLGSYGIARPSVESIYKSVHGNESLPLAWIAVAVAALVVVAIYNRFAAKVALGRLFVGVIGVVLAVLLALLVALRLEVPGAAFALYVWKDLYVVFLVEMFWIFANATFTTERAKWFYGAFLVAGSLGSMAGEFGLGPLTGWLGTRGVLWLVFPLLGGAAGGFWALSRRGVGAALARRGASSGEGWEAALSGFRALAQSRYLALLLALVALSQVVITLVDYQYSLALQAAYPDEDAYTTVSGQVYGAISAGALAVQALTGPALKLLGMPGALASIPVILGLAVGAFAVSPRFLSMAVAKVASKVFDYSLFRASKEILYIPLTWEEKTQGKAVVDILAYRVAKGATSGLLLGLKAAGAGGWVSYVTLALLGLWLAVVVALSRSWRARQDRVRA
jgi:AAA family ATP:ADP antiporter